ncbi:EamA family transporter [Acidovorax sp. IB03]|uniref:EamA family transporter n=1 Tax=Acidovorax sp. IB03 TaxID=2779366 RepID=UPI0018E7AD9E|nr:EamA family transporter [Acidovorax sp. IB03]
MSLNAFALIILAGLIHACWNIAAKKAGGDSRFAFFTSVLMMFFWAPLGWWLGRDAVPLWGAVEWGFVVASGVLHVVYYVILLRGYRKADLTVVYPLARGSGPLLSSLVAITLLGEQISALGALGIAGVVGGVFLIAGGPGLLRAAHDPAALLRGYRKADLTVVYPLARGSGPLLSSLVAITLLGEQISALGALGIAGVVGGVFLIAGGPGLLRAAHDPAARQRVHKGIAYGLLTGAFIASYTVVDGYAVKVLLMSPILIDYMGNFVRVGLLAPVVLRDLPTARTLWLAQWRFALLVAVVSPVAYVLVLYAMQQAPLSHVAPAREVSMLFAALIGGHLLGEGDRLARVCGAVCIAAGVTALALG